MPHILDLNFALFIPNIKISPSRICHIDRGMNLFGKIFKRLVSPFYDVFGGWWHLWPRRGCYIVFWIFSKARCPRAHNTGHTLPWKGSFAYMLTCGSLRSLGVGWECGWFRRGFGARRARARELWIFVLEIVQTSVRAIHKIECEDFFMPQPKFGLE